MSDFSLQLQKGTFYDERMELILVAYFQTISLCIWCPEYLLAGQDKYGGNTFANHARLYCLRHSGMYNHQYTYDAHGIVSKQGVPMNMRIEPLKIAIETMNDRYELV